MSRDRGSTKEAARIPAWHRPIRVYFPSGTVTLFSGKQSADSGLSRWKQPLDSSPKVGLERLFRQEVKQEVKQETKQEAKEESKGGHRRNRTALARGARTNDS
jgi:hypothetical protein